MQNKPFYQALSEAIDQMPVVDTHEHLMMEASRVGSAIDFFSIVMSHYFSSDLVSAGMTGYQAETLKDTSIPFEDKVTLFIPFWEKVSNTSYSRALKIAARDLYNIDQINRETLPELNRRMIEQNKPGLYKRILEENCRIAYCLWDGFEAPRKDDFFRLALRLDNVVFINSVEDIRALENRFNVSIEGLEALEDILEILITHHKPLGLTVIKTALAYERTLDYEPVSRAEAVLSMERILRNRFTERDAKVLQDYIMFCLAQKSYWHNITIQVHTGLLEGNGNFIRNANPALLSALIKANPGTRFDLFHGGYPYGGELSAMAKMFPNVYLDMAWLHIISPSYAKRYLHEWLDTVPANKLMGFGGDYVFVEGVYGHLKMAKETIARVLAEKVEDGVFTMDESLRYAKMMLYDNPDALFVTT